MSTRQSSPNMNMPQPIPRTLAFIASVLILTCCAKSQTQTLTIWPGAAPGSENWAQTEQTIEGTPLGTIVQNVVTPTLTVYLPERAKATRTGIIVAPGGACVALAIEHEGTKVARWLQEKGLAAFVLKYRIPEKRARVFLPT